jgi:hypothetical protein
MSLTLSSSGLLGRSPSCFPQFLDPARESLASPPRRRRRQVEGLQQRGANFLLDGRAALLSARTQRLDDRVVEFDGDFAYEAASDVSRA